MKWLSFSLLVVPLCLGCDSGSPSATSRESDTAKAAYEQQARENLDRLQKKIDDLKQRAEAAGAETKKRLEPEIAKLEKQADEARAKLQELRQKGEAAWQAAKPEMEKALQNLEEGFHKAVDKLKK